MNQAWLFVSLASAAALVVGLSTLAWRIWWRERQLRWARTIFPKQREHLEAKFITAAMNSGKPRGLRWKNCEWERDIAFARDRFTSNLAALVAITIQFEAIEGGDMEGLPAVGNLRNASAVFFFDQGRWQTTGKAIFNLNPDEAIQHFGKHYERIADPASRGA